MDAPASWEALRHSEQRFRALIENSLDGIALLKANGSILLFPCPATTRILGYGPDELVGQNVFALIRPDDAPLITERWQELLQKPGGNQTAQFRFRHKDGSWRWLEAVSQNLLAEPSVQAIVVNYRDITERKRVEEAYRMLVDYSLQGLAIFQEERVVFANQAMAEIIGYTVEEMLAMSPGEIQAFVHPEDRALVWGRHRDRLAGKPLPDRYELRGILKDGSICWLEIQPKLINYWGKPAIQAAYVEVTERKQAEEALRESEQRYRVLVETAPDVIYTISAEDGTLTSLNQVFETITGWPRAEWLGKPFAGLVHPDDLPLALETFQNVSRGATLAPYELRILSKSGKYIVGEFTSIPQVKEGEVIGELGIARNITERKRAEEALRELSRRLGQAKDEERRRIARELHDSTSQKLAAMTMNLGMLGEVVAGKYRWAREARKLLNESLALLEDCSQEVRTLSYLLHPPLLDQLGLAVALRSYVEGFANRSGVQVALEMPQDLGRLPAEVELTLFRVVQECLSNIHRHSGCRTAEIRLALESGRVTLEVSDQGHGIPEQTLQAIEKGTARPGLGISEMRERLSHVGGELEIKSSAQGTTIWIIIHLTSGGL